jgi:O-antigen/teichoic acid export membrane protein
MTLGLAAVTIATAPLWDPLLKDSLRLPILLALAASALFVVVENSQSLLRVLDRPVAFVVLSLTATLGGPLIGLGLLTQQRSPERYLSGLILGYGAAAAVGLVLCLRGGRPQSDRGDTRAALRMGLPVIPHLVALYLASFAAVILGGHLYDIATAGRIHLALIVGSAPAVITSALNNSWAPIIYRATDRERGAVLSHTARDIATLAALMSGGVALLSPWLMQLVASQTFRPLELVPTVAIVSFGCVLSVAYLANVHLVFAAGRSLWLSVITPLSLLFGLTCAYLAGLHDPLLLGVSFPATYAALAVGVALLRRYLHAARWNETALLLPAGLGLALCAMGGVLPTDGTASLIRVLVAAGAGIGALRLARRVLQ